MGINSPHLSTMLSHPFLRHSSILTVANLLDTVFPICSHPIVPSPNVWPQADVQTPFFDRQQDTKALARIRLVRSLDQATYIRVLFTT